MQLAAQDGSAKRSGFWFNIGAGYGTADYNCGDCGTTNRKGGTSANVGFGLTLSKQLLVGVESDGWYKKEGALHSLFGNSTFAGYFYPSPTADLFLKGGLGSSSYLFRNGESVDDSGLGLMAGAGYDIPIGKRTSLTPTVTFSFGNMGDHSGDRSVKINWLQFGAALTFH